jgi:hypothetical protein
MLVVPLAANPTLISQPTIIAATNTNSRFDQNLISVLLVVPGLQI